MHFTSVFPVDGKRPAVTDWTEYRNRDTTHEELRAWGDTQLAAVVNERSGLIMLDADNASEELVKRNYVLPRTGTLETSPGCYRYFFQRPDHSDWLRNIVLWKGQDEHQELKLVSDHYFVLPHRSNPARRWKIEAPAAVAPEWLVHWAREETAAILCNEHELLFGQLYRPIDDADLLDMLQTIDPKVWDNWWTVGGALKSMGDDKLPLFIAWARLASNFDEALSKRYWTGYDGRIRAGSLIHLAKQCGWRPKKSIYEPLNNYGDAEILARMQTGRLLYNRKMGWFVYDGKRYTNTRGDEEAQEAAKAVYVLRRTAALSKIVYIEKQLQTARQGKDERTEKEVEKVRKLKLRTLHLIDTRGEDHHICGTVHQARSVPALWTADNSYDQHPPLINFENGTFNLDTDELREHRHEDKLTKLCPHPYDPHGVYERFDRFLSEVFASDFALIHWLHKFFGYCMSGYVTDHILPIFHGNGRNGKTTLVETIAYALGEDYAATTPEHFFEKSINDRHPTEIMDLRGMRFVYCEETDENRQLNTSRAKKLTGGGRVKSRHMGKDFVPFQMTAKYVISTNHEPIVSEQSVAAWGRIRKIPFNVNFLGREDKNLLEVLKGEAVGILRWMVEGYRLWRSEGLGDPPASIVEATKEYQHEQNTLVRFFDERLAKDVTAKTAKKAIMEAYHAWCYTNHTRQESGKAFGHELAAWYGPGFCKTNLDYFGIKLQ